MNRRRSHDQRHGQAAIEVTLLWTVVLAAIVLLYVYVQRAIQGGLHGTASFLGLQFDPRDAYLETQNTSTTEVTQSNTLGPMIQAQILKSPASPSPSDRAKFLPSLPRGPVPREPAASTTQVRTTWDAQTKASYDDVR